MEPLKHTNVVQEYNSFPSQKLPDVFSSFVHQNGKHMSFTFNTAFKNKEQSEKRILHLKKKQKNESKGMNPPQEAERCVWKIVGLAEKPENKKKAFYRCMKTMQSEDIDDKLFAYAATQSILKNEILKKAMHREVGKINYELM